MLQPGDFVFIGVIVIYICFSLQVIQRFLPSNGWRFFIIFTVVSLVVFALDLIGRRTMLQTNPFWKFYFDLQAEKNLPATFSSVQLFVGVPLALILAWADKREAWWVRLYWMVIMMAFGYLAMDEYFLLHEVTGLDWQRPYMIVGFAIGLYGLVVMWKLFRNKRQQLLLMVLMYGGLALAVAGGVGIELLVAKRCARLVPYSICSTLIPVEEVFEIVGVTIAVSAIFSLTHIAHRSLRWKQLATILVALFAVLIIASYWVFPAVAQRLIATPVEVTFSDGAIELLGYQISHKDYEPADTLTLVLYLRNNTRPSDNYGVSLHLLTKPDAQSIAFTNYHGLEPLPRRWAEGLVQAIYVPLELPTELDVSASYWLGVSLWKHGNLDIIPIDTSSESTLSSQMALLGSISIVVPENNDEGIANDQFFQFSNGISLDSSLLSITGANRLQGDFRWRTSQSIDSNLIQILHLHHQESDEVIILDRPPSGESFPTEDWPANLDMIVPVEVDLPEDMPPGHWEVYSGLYDSLTKTRVPVTSEDGSPFNDGLFSLGVIQID